MIWRLKILGQPKIKCENVFDGKQCDSFAKVRTIKKEMFRVYNRSHVSGDLDKSYRAMVLEKFLCLACAQMEEDYEIVEWISEKVPYELLFGIKGFSLKDAERLGVKYWELSDERRLRWEEQVFCPNCGDKITHEVRYYTDDDGYDSPNRWVNAHRTIHCKNCGFFDYLYREKKLGYSRKQDDAGMYHGFKKPDNDPDYKKWEEIQKKSKALKEEVK